MTLHQAQSKASNVFPLLPNDRAVVVDPHRLHALTDALTKSVHENIYRSRLMAVAGHDLKQPLQVLGMLFERLVSQTTDSKAESWVQLAFEAIMRIADGLDQLALSSRLDAQIDFQLRQTRNFCSRVLSNNFFFVIRKR
jgi:light-regulated signal transduction histidine kinase (bacteriophytochrome)